ncbi:MAG: YitT family protein, partial [Herbinix sp.]|nr:YitT family protein [Herbinix sp.]
AFLHIGRNFFIQTIVDITFQTIFLSIIPIPSTPIISDLLTACIAGGLIAGYGVGITLKSGGSSGGQDILGMYCIKKFPNVSIGKIGLLISSFVYLYCFFKYDIEITIYSIILTVFLSFAIDKTHLQNIKTSVMIFTKDSNLANIIIKELHRGATKWNGVGAYTNQDTNVIITVISKYEVNQLKQLVHNIDQQAFVILYENISVDGSFQKRL